MFVCAGCRGWALICSCCDRGLVAVDGTRLKAVNSRDRNFTREKLAKLLRDAEQRLADYLGRLDRTDAEESPASSPGDEPGGEDRQLEGAPDRLHGAAGRVGADGREPGIADRPGQPGYGGTV